MFIENPYHMNPIGQTEQEKKDNETPNPKWATWGLVREARKLANLPPIIGWCLDRLEALNVGDGHKPAPCAFIITTNSGHWGRGKTIAEAAKTALKAGGRRTDRATVTLVINDETPEVNKSGYLITDSMAAHKQLGCVGTLGSILNANKDV
jgi:hypothetical protein